MTFIECSLRARNCFKRFTHILPPATPCCQLLYGPHFTNEEFKAARSAHTVIISANNHKTMGLRLREGWLSTSS